MTKTIRRSQIHPARAGTLYSNGAVPLADFDRNYGRYMGGDSAGFTGATAGNNALTHSWLSDAGGSAPALGDWYASSGAFPTARPDAAPIQAGDNWRVIDSGTVDGTVFTGGQKLVALVATPGATYAGNWLLASTLQYFETQSRFVQTTSSVPIAATFGAKAVSSLASGIVIGGTFAGMNDSGNAAVKAEGIYVEGIRNRAGAGYTTGAEIQITDKAGDVTAKLTPYSGLANGMTFGQIIGSGGDATVNTTSYPATAAMNIDGNGNKFRSGVVFQSDALLAWTDSLTRAVLMPTLACVSWSAPGDIEVARITSTSALAADAQEIRLNSLGVSFLNDVGDPYFFVNNGPNSVAVNYLSVSSAATGSGPSISASGPDANIDLPLIPKGSGLVSFGALTANADAAITGYVSIKTASGATVKLAVIA